MYNWEIFYKNTTYIEENEQPSELKHLKDVNLWKCYNTDGKKLHTSDK